MHSEEMPYKKQWLLLFLNRIGASHGVSPGAQEYSPDPQQDTEYSLTPDGLHGCFLISRS